MSPVLGVVLPVGISEKWLNVHVRVIESGNCIILESGAPPVPMTKTEIRHDSKKLEVVYL